MRSAFLLTTVLLTAGALRVAHADAGPPMLALPTIIGGYVSDRAGWQREFDARIAKAVRRGGREPRPPGPLTTAEASCRDAQCMARVAEGAGIGIVLGAKVTADRGSPPSYKLVVTRYDRERPGFVRQEEADCSVCTELETAERLEQMVAVMLPALVVHAPPRVDSPVAPPPDPSPPPNKGLSRTTLYALVGATAAVGAAGIVMLGVGAQGIAIDGAYVEEPVSGARYARDRYDSRAAGIGLVAAGSVFLVGAATGLVFEIRALKRSPR